MSHFDLLPTEGRLEDSLNLDRLGTEEMLKLMNREDEKVAVAVRAVIPELARAVDLVADRLRSGGRLIYVGAGTSGRMGALDAAECPPTFGVSPDIVRAVMAGGTRALQEAVEGVEDDAEAGADDLRAVAVGRDVVVGVAASGSTSYTIGALKAANALGCATIAVTCNPDTPMSTVAQITIAPVVGPEVVMGSTRLKAGTAQKMVLNALSTGAMVRLGKVYTNLMVDMNASNIKLRHRARRMVQMACDVSAAVAEEALNRANMQVKLAIVMLQTGTDVQEAARLLQVGDGFVYRAIEAARAT